MKKTKFALVPLPIKKFLKKIGIWDKARLFGYREKKASFGKLNPDKTIYIIRRIPCEAGLFSYILTILARIEKAENNGWEPVVDMQNYFNSYISESEIGKVNSWEYYFLQPGNVSLEEAYKSKKVILSNGWVMSNRARMTQDLVDNKDGILDKWRSITRKYLVFNDETKQYLEKEYQRVIPKDSRVLGVIIRGSDYTTLKPKGHAIQPEIDDVISKAKEVMKEYNCSYIFLATEDKKNYKSFLDAFGEGIVLTNRTNWIDYKGGYINTYYSDSIRKNDRYLSGLEYLATIYILSKSNCIIGGTPGGASGAMLLSESYEYHYFWFLGYY